MDFQLNQIIRWQINEEKIRHERIIDIDAVSSEVWTIDIEDKRAFTKFYKYEDLLAAITAKQALVIVNYTPFKIITLPDDELSLQAKKHIEYRDAAWELIAPLIEKQIHKFFDSKSGRHEISKRASETGRQTNKIYFQLRRYFQRGCTKNALFPDWHNCGKTEGSESQGKKRGRKNSNGESTGRNLTPDDHKKFDGGIKDYIIKGKHSLPGAWQLIKERDYCTGTYEITGILEEETLVPVLLPADEIPTFGQFKYYYYKNRNPGEEIKKSEGLEEYERNNRPVLDHSTRMAFGPGAVYQIDATIGDIYLLHSDRKRIIGRPVIYIVIDVFSRMITGFAVTLEGPSWEGARIALQNAFSNKVAYCKSLGINITEDMWPVEGKCESLLGDNGEIKSYNANSLVDPLGIRVSNAAPYRPDWKGIVEQNFRTIKGEYIKFTPGEVRQRRKVRGRDYRLEARLTLGGFRKLMALCAIQHNNHHEYDDYPLDQQMMSDGIVPIPSQLWEYGMRHLTGRLREVNEESMYLSLLPKGKATTTAEGLRFRNLCFTCERAIQEGWFERIKGKKAQSFAVALEPIVDRIRIVYERGKWYETCELTPAFKRFSGMDWYEVREYFASRRERKRVEETERQQAKAEFHAQLNSVITTETELSEQALSSTEGSKSEMIKGTRESRKEMKQLERKNGIIPADEKSIEAQVSNVLSEADAEEQLAKLPTPGDYVPPAKHADVLRAAKERAKQNVNK